MPLLIAKIYSENKMETKKPVVIFDLDSTLNNLHEVIAESFKKHLNQNKHHTTWEQYHLSTTYGLPFDSVISHIEKHNLLDKSIPLPGAQSLIQTLKPKYEIGIMTARASFNEPWVKTLRWLLSNEMEPNWIEIVQSDKHKLIKKKVGQCDFFLDDCPQHLIDVLEAGAAKKVGTLDYVWSKNLPSDILRFANLKEVSDYLC